VSNGYEIAGSVLNASDALWLLIDAMRIRRTIRAESGAARLQEILKQVGAGDVLRDRKGRPLNSEKALRLWFAARTIAWNWVALGLILMGFILDLWGKTR